MISVALASYNGEKYIEKQIASILRELGEGDELVISDDGSTDRTIEIIKSFDDSRINLITNPGPAHGTRANSENALCHTRGDLIFMSDQDDLWMPGKVSTMLNVLTPGIDLVHHDSVVTDEGLNELSPSLYELMNNGPGVIKNMKRGSFYGSHMLITRRLLELCKPFPENDEVGHDLWIGLVASMKCQMKFIPDKLIYYRRHESAHCDLFKPSKRSLATKLYGRVVMLKYIARFLLKNHGS